MVELFLEAKLQAYLLNITQAGHNVGAWFRKKAIYLFK